MFIYDSNREVQVSNRLLYDRDDLINDQLCSYKEHRGNNAILIITVESVKVYSVKKKVLRDLGIKT